MHTVQLFCFVNSFQQLNKPVQFVFRIEALEFGDQLLLGKFFETELLDPGELGFVFEHCWTGLRPVFTLLSHLLGDALGLLQDPVSDLGQIVLVYVFAHTELVCSIGRTVVLVEGQSAFNSVPLVDQKHFVLVAFIEHPVALLVSHIALVFANNLAHVVPCPILPHLGCGFAFVVKHFDFPLLFAH